ncbi:unnamed protein product [Arabis nemorensis]|uniref:Replication factor A C-terminal domain-containing protein n=1 Tax=Arabis nemorensis TaxID=586526 RepID=A0A565CPA0_9BRAS|nr:unnamed protein product [Arabis nemorensis]
MILVDDEGMRLSAFVDFDCGRQFCHQLMEGNSLRISRFGLMESRVKYRPIYLPFGLQFLPETIIKELDLSDKVPRNKYLKSFPRILSPRSNKRYLFDVIGQIICIHPLKKVPFNGIMISRLNIELRDNVDSRLTCILWDGYADAFTEYARTNITSYVVCSLVISNYLAASKILIDPETLQNGFINSLLRGDEIDLTPNDTIDQSNITDVSLHDEFFNLNPRMNIRQAIYADKEGSFVVIVNVDFVDKLNPWYYHSCKICKSKVLPYLRGSNATEPLIYHCDKICKHDVYDVDVRYFLILQVSDLTGESIRVLFLDGIAQSLFCVSAKDLLDSINENDEAVLPSTIKGLEGKEFLLKLGISDDNVKARGENYIVRRFCDDVHMINMFRSL